LWNSLNRLMHLLVLLAGKLKVNQKPLFGAAFFFKFL
jgi:hypothetical protein